MGLIQLARETKARLGIRRALQSSSWEELQITKEELKREFERRNKKGSKKPR